MPAIWLLCLTILLIIIALSSLLAWSVKRQSVVNEQRVAAYEQLAQTYGWSYEAMPNWDHFTDLYQLRATERDGWAWSLDLMTGNPGTCWYTDEVDLPNGLVFICPRPRKWVQGLGQERLPDKALSAVLHNVIGHHTPEDAQLRELENISAKVARFYLVFTVDELPARRLLTPAVENSLARLGESLTVKKRPVVVFWQHSLRIESAGLLPDTREVQNIVALGRSLIVAWRDELEPNGAD